jgi:hypothetical protein
MSTIKPDSATNPSMPQLDFGQTFAIAEENALPPTKCVELDQAELGHQTLRQNGIARLAAALRLGRLAWTNITLVLVTSCGGLFCAFYFFNGAELLRAGAAWSREFLYPRPALTQNGKIDLHLNAGDQASPITENYRTPRDRDGNPFRRNVGSLYPNPSSASTSPGPGATSPLAGPFANAGSLLNQLNLPAPGGDALLQAFNRAVTDLARANSLDAHRTVVVVQTPASQSQQRTSTGAKSAAQRTKNAATKSNVQQTTHNSAQTSPATATQNQAATAVRSANNISQQTMGAVRGMTSSPMSGMGSVRAPAGSLGGRR